MTSLFVEQLTVIDCAYLDATRGLVGESWIVDIELIGDLDEQSMVLDFGEVKRRIKKAIDQSADHTLIVPQRASGLSLHQAGERSSLSFRSARGLIEHHSPSIALSVADTDRIDAAAVIAYLQPRVAAVLPPNVDELRLSLRSERIDGAFYHYVHGLKKHDGHCQRIAHGHRSRIHIGIGGQRQPALEAALAQRWADIYLGTNDDLVDSSGGQCRYAYTAAEGRFELALPAAHVENLPGDTTVERIAEWIASGRWLPDAPAALEVRAYEGVMKGAIARRPIAA